MGRAPTDTKEKLLSTAIELIWANSYNAVSVDDICKKAGVKKGSFYHFFPSKAHLALETMQGCLEQTIERYNDIFSAARPPLERLTLMIEHVLDQQREVYEELGHVCGCPFATLGSELAAQDPEIGATINEACAKKSVFYKSALQDLIRDGLIDPQTDVDLKADEIFAFIVGQLIMARIKNDLNFLEDNLQQGLFNLIGVKNITTGQKKLTA